MLYRSSRSWTYHSPFRSAAYETLVSLLVTWILQITGNIQPTLDDSQSVVNVFQRCNLSGSQLASSQDYWDEIG